VKLTYATHGVWSVYDCEACALLRHVVWADDETAQYAQRRHDGKQYVLNESRTETLIDVVQAKRITFAWAARTVLVNPLDDEIDGVANADKTVTA
jgi:hypothetical protein